MSLIDSFLRGKQMETNKYYQLISDLESGELSLSLVSMAIRTYVGRNKKIPEGVRNLLTSPEGGGYIHAQFRIIQNMIGTMELAYRRGSFDK